MRAKANGSLSAHCSCISCFIFGKHSHKALSHLVGQMINKRLVKVMTRNSLTKFLMNFWLFRNDDQNMEVHVLKVN